jgi:signal transduction histidine kinase
MRVSLSTMRNKTDRNDARGIAPGPHNLTVRTRQNAESDFVEVRISDSGKGIPECNLASIFDAFVTTKPQGTGLGLPIARTILESYGGDIWAENRQLGAVFSFRLPLARTHAGQMAMNTSQGAAHRNGLD